MYGLLSHEDMLRDWKNRIGAAYSCNDQTKERMIILGMLDFLKGKEFLMNLDGSKKHIQLKKIKVKHKLLNRLLWRYAEWMFNRAKGSLDYEK